MEEEWITEWKEREDGAAARKVFLKYVFIVKRSPFLTNHNITDVLSARVYAFKSTQTSLSLSSIKRFENDARFSAIS